MNRLATYLTGMFALCAGLAFADATYNVAAGGPAVNVNDLVTFILPTLLGGATGEHLYDLLLAAAAKIGVPIAGLGDWWIRLGTLLVSPVVCWLLSKVTHVPFDPATVHGVFTLGSTAIAMIVTNHVNAATGR